MTCTETWNDEIGCWPSDRSHQCEVRIPHHVFHRCSCDAWIQDRPDYATAAKTLGNLPELSPLTLASLHDVARAALTPDCDLLPAEVPS